MPFMNCSVFNYKNVTINYLIPIIPLPLVSLGFGGAVWVFPEFHPPAKSICKLIFVEQNASLQSVK